MDCLDAVQLFVRAVEAGSLTRAADLTGICLTL